MPKKSTITEKKQALFERYVRVYQNYYKGKNGIPVPFTKSWSYSTCEKAYKEMKQAIHIDKTQRRYLARIADLPLTPELQNETMAQVTLKHFFTDSQIKQFPFGLAENPYYSSSASMKIYNLYDVMIVAKRRKLTPRIKNIDFDRVQEQHREKLKRLVSYFESYLQQVSKNNP